MKKKKRKHIALKTFRLSLSEIKKLKQYTTTYKVSNSEAIRRGIEALEIIF